mmetsp:Transcript_46222/g.131857  ORF Transcript_46222/g.131857 Transcript_46222/m.131857 type:complete len:132 (+) Transcript_46222:129-524(+)
MTLASDLGRQSSAAAAAFSEQASERIQVIIKEELQVFCRICKERARLGHVDAEMDTDWRDVSDLFQWGARGVMHGTADGAASAVASSFQLTLEDMGFHSVQVDCYRWLLRDIFFWSLSASWEQCSRPDRAG